MRPVTCAKFQLQRPPRHLQSLDDVLHADRLGRVVVDEIERRGHVGIVDRRGLRRPPLDDVRRLDQQPPAAAALRPVIILSSSAAAR